MLLLYHNFLFKKQLPYFASVFFHSSNYHFPSNFIFFLNSVRFFKFACIYSRGAYNTVRSGQRHLRPCSAVLFKCFASSYICIQIFNTLFVSITVRSFFFYCSCVFHFCVALHFIYNVFQVVHLFTPPTYL